MLLLAVLHGLNFWRGVEKSWPMTNLACMAKWQQEMDRSQDWWAIFIPGEHLSWQNRALARASCFDSAYIAQELVERGRRPEGSRAVNEAVKRAWATGRTEVVQYVALMRSGWTRLEAHLQLAGCGNCPRCRFIVFYVRSLGPDV